MAVLRVITCLLLLCWFPLTIEIVIICLLVSSGRLLQHWLFFCDDFIRLDLLIFIIPSRIKIKIWWTLAAFLWHLHRMRVLSAHLTIAHTAIIHLIIHIFIAHLMTSLTAITIVTPHRITTHRSEFLLSIHRVSTLLLAALASADLTNAIFSFL